LRDDLKIFKQVSGSYIFNPNPHCWVAKSSTFRKT
jgi:hypothetical protein